RRYGSYSGQRHFAGRIAPVEPALFLRREGHRGTAPGRHGEHRNIPQGTTEGIPVELRRSAQRGSDHPARRAEAETGFRALRLCYRQEYQARSEEHTSELQSRFDLVCSLLLEKKK